MAASHLQGGFIEDDLDRGFEVQPDLGCECGIWGLRLSIASWELAMSAIRLLLLLEIPIR